MKSKVKKALLLNANGHISMILSATVLLLCTACFWFLQNPTIIKSKSSANTEVSVLQKMKPIVVKATKPAAQGDTSNLKNSNWFATIQKEMSKSEYFIKEDAASGTLGSPNRKNNLRFTYDANGFSVKPRATKIPLEENKPGQDPDDIKYKTIKDWAIRFDLNNSQWGDGYWKIANNKAEYITDKVTVQYDNQEEGMRQNFVVHTPLEKGKKLTIGFKVSTSLKVTTNKEALDFGLNGEQVMQYKDLKVWDANGKTLTASLQYKGKEAYSIEVDDSKAIYPITIDPISTTAAAMVESNQASASMGISVAGAGDVNGDGYSDVIVGANTYDNGQTDEGAAFIYHGSAAGISTTAAVRVESNNAAAQMGISVSGAGDVNGDGYSDVIVGARLYSNGQTNEGAAFVYYGSSTGINSTAAWIVESNQAGAQMGSSVSGGGDVNGDGYSDVVVGAFQYSNGQTNEGVVYVYHGSATGISTTATSMVESNQASAGLGLSVAGAGDVNGDGYSDVIVGAYAYDNGQTDEGAAFVYHGSATGISTTAAARVESNQASAWFGYTVSGAGDVNGDGYSDIIVGAIFYDNGQTDEGAAFVYHGSATGISTTASAMVESNQASASLGIFVSGAGDVNGDGYSDVIVGANGYDNGQTDEGAAFVYHGSATGISTTATTMVESNQASASMGGSVAGAGDVNGDGYSDVIVGANGYDNGQTDEGAAFVYHGSASGISTTASSTVESNQAGAQMGFSVSGAGDVNGDGYSDVIIGAPTYDNGQTDEGAAFVFHGSATGISTTAAARVELNQVSAYLGWSVSGAGDVNGDGFSDVIVSSHQYDNGQTDEGAAFVYHGSATGISTTATSMVESNQASALMGWSVSGAGDVNGDGYSDVIVGAPNYDNGQTDEGAAFVYHGSATGISTTAAAMVESNQASAQMGLSVSGAGDVNGDGYSDVIVGVQLYDNGQTDEGAAFVYHGSATGISTTATAIVESNQATAYLGCSVSGAGDVNGDGYSDVIVGANAYDNGQTDEGAAFVYHGSATGINTTAAARVETNQASAYISFVSGAGDVNGDGYSDVIVGSNLYDNGQTNEGAAFVYHGSATGISTTAAAMVESNQASAYMSYVSGAGDVNGDGYSDVIVGATAYDNGLTDEGAAFVYLGNGGGSRAAANNIRAYNADASTRINQTNASQSSFGAGLYVKSFQGRTKGKLVWEVVGNGSPFSGGTAIGNSVSNTSQQSSFTNLGLAGVSLANSISKTSSKSNKVRVRVKYDVATSLFGQVYGPWRYLYGAKDLQGIVKLSDNTSGVASSTPTLCINTAITNITHTTTGATGISNDNVAGANGLPAGVKAQWASNLITISGTPTASGTFNYSIPLTGGTGSVNATGTITVTAVPTPSFTAQPGATACASTDVTYTTESGKTNYVWTVPGTLNTDYTITSGGIGTTSNTVTLKWLTAGSKTITINYTSSGCTAASATSSTATTVSTLPTPTISAGGATNFCNGGSVLLTAGNTTGNVKSGNALTFNSASSRYVSVPHSASLNLSDFTMEAWVNYSGANRTIIDKGNYDFLWSLNANSNGNKMGFYNNSNTTWYYSTAAVAQNTWTHVAITLSGGTLTFYINGVASGTASVGYASDNIEMNIGRQQPSSCKCNHFNGTMDELRIWNVARSQSEILATYETTVPTNSSGLVAYYKFDESTGTTTADASGNGNTGTLVNGPTWQVPSTSPVLLHNAFIWYNNATVIGTTQSITAATAGSYTVNVTLPNGCAATSGATAVTVTPNNTAGTASSTPTLCINTALTNITHTTTGATGIGTATGLPTGVTASWATNTITIIGTPTSSGTFNYSIPLVGGCGSVNATGTITVTAANTVSNASSAPTLCINTALTNITHTTTGSTGISNDNVAGANGLPAGVKAHWVGSVITISGTPTAFGTFYYSILLTGGCGSISATGTISVVDIPIANITNNSGTNILDCITTSISLTANGGTSYSWSNGTTIVGTNSDLSVSVPGIYTVTVTGTGECKATSAIEIRENTFTTTIVSSTASTVLTCNNPIISLTAINLVSRGPLLPSFTDNIDDTDTGSHAIDGYTYSWSKGTSIVGKNATLAVNDPGTYSVTVTRNNGCIATNIVTLTKLNDIATIGSYQSTTVIASQNTTITPTVAPTNSTSIVAYSTTNFNGTFTVNPTTGVVSVTNARKAGSYLVTVKATNNFGCTALTTFTLNVTNTGCIQVNFGGTTNVSVGSNSFSVAIGDFNRDGKQDIATANYDANSVSIRLGDGTGGFSGSTNVSVGDHPWSVAIGDFNGDGKQDIAATNNGSSSVSIRIGDGNGGLSGSTNVSVGTGPQSIAIGDFNGDGKQDIATANSTSSSVSIRLGDGNGGFNGSTNVNVGSYPTSIAIGDFNSDGKQDIVSANYESNSVSIRLGDGIGGFNGTTNLSVDSGPNSIAIGDFNGDGKQDIATANYSSTSVSIRLGDGNGGFSGSTNVSVGSIPYSVAIGDFNADGKQDIAVTNAGSNSVSIRLGDGNGGFSGNTELSVGTSPTSVSIGDFNGDGKQDIAAANYGSSSVSIRLGVGNVINIGTYPRTTVTVGQNITITPTVTLPNITSIVAYSTTDFSGTITINPTNGVLRITNAKHAGTYLVTVKATYNGGCDAVTTFTLIVNNPICSQGNFNSSKDVSVGTKSLSVAIGDFNGDGKQDIAIANNNSNTVSIRLGDGNGGFGVSKNVSIGTIPWSVAIGDFNGDGKQDIAATNNGSSSVSIRLGDGNGGLSGSTNVSVGTGPQSIAIGDFNGDGKQDIATANSTSSSVSIRLGDGNGGFNGSTNVNVGSYPTSIAIGDFNSDGKQDIVSANYESNSVSIRLGDGIGGFNGTTNLSVDSGPNSVAIGDFNGDGKQDIATANYGSTTVSIRLGNGNGGFSGSTNVSVGSIPNSVAIGDFNGDGKQDIAVTNAGSNSVSIRLGDGNGGFSGNTELSVGTSPTSVSIGDFNGDGKQDIATANFNSNSVSLLLAGNCEIDITGNEVSIVDGDNKPSFTDDTDFGSTCISSKIIKTYFIKNTANTNLTINSGAITVTGSDNAMFAISNITLPVTIEGYSSTFFTVTFTPTSAGIKTATIHIASDDCNEADYDFAVQANVSSSITLGITNNVGTTELNCSNSSINLIATGDGTSYSWSNGSTDVGTNSVLTVTTPGTYTVTGSNGCTDTSSVTITGSITVASIFNNTGTTVLNCATPAISLTAIGSGTYSWSNGTAVVGTSATLSVTTPATYTVTVTGTNGCTATDPITITKSTVVAPTLAIANSAGTTELSCTKKTIPLTASGATYYYWTKNGVIVSTNAAFTVTTPGTYIATGSSTTGVCSGIKSVTITQNANFPVALITNNTGATQIDCINTAISLTASGGTSYSWSNGSTVVSSAAALSATAAGTYTVTVTNTGSGCTSTSSISITKNITTSTAATLSGSTTITNGGSANLSVAITGGNAPFTIVLSNGTSNFTTTNYYPLKPTISVNPTTNTNYTLVSVTGSNGCAGTGNATSAAVVNVSAPSTKSWIGSFSRLWSDGWNWSGLTKPNENDVIIIGKKFYQPQLNIDFTVRGSLTLTGTGTTLTVNAGKSLSVGLGATVDFGGKEVTFKSNATGTAQLGRMQGTLNNASNVVVERYFPAGRRAYRMISPSVTSTTSIKFNWMEGATLGVTTGYPYTAGSASNPNGGYGTQITGTGGTTNGFDATSTNGYSVLRFSNIGQYWSALTNTNGTLTAGDAYNILIRGDRGVNLNSNIADATATTLRTRGTLKTGTQVVTNLSSAWGGWNLIGNPYNAQVDMRAVSSTNMTPYYTVWDPTSGTKGAYVSFHFGTGITSNSNSKVNELLQPGQAFLVQTDNPGAATFTFEEQDKTPAGTQTSVFSPLTVYPVLNSALYYTDSLANNQREMDAFGVVFDYNFSNEVDREDGKKNTNTDENMSVNRDGALLSLELRSMYNDNTVIPIHITNYKRQNYTMRLAWNNPVDEGYEAKLVDNYNGTETAINFSGNTDYMYTVNSSIPGSIAADRFKIVFVPNAALPVSSLTLTGAAKGNAVALQYEALNERDMQGYAIERSADGAVFNKLGEHQPVNGTAASNRYNYTDNNPLAGVNYYRIKGSSINGQLQYSNVITVKAGSMVPTVTVAPNPIANKVLNLKLSQLNKGSYRMTVTDVAGRTIFSKEMVYDGVSSAIKTSLPVTIKPGNYYVRLSGEGSDFTEKFIIQ